MSRTFPGDPATYVEFEAAVVVDGVTGALLRSLPGGQVFVNGVLVSYREPMSGAVATTVQTNAFAQLPGVLVPMPDGVTIRTAVVTVDWPDDGVSAQRLRPTQEEYFDEVDRITLALADEANASRLAAESALSQLEAYIAAGGGDGGTGGAGLTPEQEAILAAFDASVASAEAGQALLWDEDAAVFRPGPLPTPTVTADDILQGTLGYARLPEGVMVMVDKATASHGAPAGSWPTAHPAGAAKVHTVWLGDQVGTDGPGTIMRASDKREFVDPA